ncbi:unnamed protein product, partial [Cylicostephanus goldi]
APEFPYINPAASIKLGKFQCAICEASLPDTAQILKHATFAQRVSYQPRSAAEELVMEAGSSNLTIAQPGSTAEVETPVCSASFETFSDKKILNNFSQTSEVLVSASAPLECTSQQAAFGPNLHFTYAGGKDAHCLLMLLRRKSFCEVPDGHHT